MTGVFSCCMESDGSASLLLCTAGQLTERKQQHFSLAEMFDSLFGNMLPKQTCRIRQNESVNKGQIFGSKVTFY